MQGRPRAIVADPAHGRIFWIDSGLRASIRVADMGGRNQRTFLRGGDNVHPDDHDGVSSTTTTTTSHDRPYYLHPNGLTLVHDRNLLCVSDSGDYAAIYCVNADNATDRFKVFPVRHDQYAWPTDITTDGDRLFWPDRGAKTTTTTATPEMRLRGADLKGHEVFLPGAPVTKAPYSIGGVAYMKRRCPAGGLNGCGERNGGCQHFCFARQDGSTACARPGARNGGAEQRLGGVGRMQIVLLLASLVLKAG